MEQKELIPAGQKNGAIVFRISLSQTIYTYSCLLYKLCETFIKIH